MAELMEAPSLDSEENQEQENPFSVDGSKFGLDISPAVKTKTLEPKHPAHTDIEPRITGIANLDALEQLAMEEKVVAEKTPLPIDEYGIAELELKKVADVQSEVKPIEIHKPAPQKVETRQHPIAQRRVSAIIGDAVQAAKPTIPSAISKMPAGPSAAEEDVSDIPESGLATPELLRHELKSIKDKNILIENRGTRSMALADYKERLAKERPNSVRAKHIEVLLAEQQLALQYIDERIKEIAKGGIFKKIGGWFKKSR